ncbi:winged helix-turn-helix transcriptional regulator [Nonomuraea gerenzanensis]|uniref:Transcriptional regulator, HxlR family n=1 Tax=Nonomuraea gerenzanensis TaxID=93944 RepID=A0A1M4EEH9_9ACTN|nr:helix-turn-helix domain-containing protein [Nonomuraea gerenzanensis]UBU09008.1 helix-turn-helix transcriptional regulator [Nonomuraea gerenzanensis]SBO97391.1 Transcriptional regulator, HxlR family [Nonomuraea gerenzanensis]
MSHQTEADRVLRSLGRTCLEHDPEMLRSVLDRVGDKWSLILIGLLDKGPMRFTELLRTAPGISRRMLSLTLRGLERDGLVKRVVFPEIPPRVEYEVTPFGRTLSEPVLTLARWAAANEDTIRANRRAFDEAAGLD